MSFHEEMLQRFKAGTLEKISALKINNGIVSAETWNSFETDMLNICQFEWCCLSESEMHEALTKRLVELELDTALAITVLTQLQSWPEETTVPFLVGECVCALQA